MPSMNRRLSIVGVVFLLLALASPVWAHVDAPLGAPAVAPDTPAVAPDTPAVAAAYGPEALSATRTMNPGRWLLAASVAVVLAVTLRRRRALMLALVLLLACGAFEAGLHAVHHLTEADAAKCSITAVSSHTGGVVVVTVAVERPADVVTEAVVFHVAALAPSNLFAPDLGRAPPAA
jgi:hypothetical protein